MPYVFGYGSLVDAPSLQVTIQRPLAAADGPCPARLRGFRRSWNVAVHSSSRPDYAFVDARGDGWSGWFVFLGLERSAPDAVGGALFRLEPADLAKLDVRERSYDRVDVTDLIDSPATALADQAVFTYVPKAQVREQARQAGETGLIMARYLRLVDRGYRALGDVRYAEHLRSLPDHAPVPVAEITAAPLDKDATNEALDPSADH